jgi:hypothetical protein
MKVMISFVVQTIFLTFGIMVLPVDLRLSFSQEMKNQVTQTVDPCSFATSNQIKEIISSEIKNYFPLNHSKDGSRITISDPRLTGVTCPDLHTTVLANILYDKAAGFPQFSTSGNMSFTSPLVARVTYDPNARYNIQKASACLTDVTITELNLEDIPAWIDNTWMKKCLNGELPDWTYCEDFVKEICFDITGYVDLYVQKYRVPKE